MLIDKFHGQNAEVDMHQIVAGGLCRPHDMPKQMQDFDFFPSNFMSAVDA